MSVKMKSLALAGLVIAAFSTAASALSVDLSLIGNGRIGDPLVISTTDNVISFNATSAESRGLRATQGLNALFGGSGICADGKSQSIAAWPVAINTSHLTNCRGTLEIDFQNPLSQLSVGQYGVSLLTDTSVTVKYAGGTVTGDVKSFLDISLLSIVGRTLTFTGFDQITAVSFNTASLLDTGIYYGRIDYVNYVEPVPSAVPLPAAGAFLLGGLGGLGAISAARRKKDTQC